MKILKPNALVSQVYNDGIITFYSESTAFDEFGTPILGGGQQDELALWYRRIGSRAEDVFYARSLGQDIDLKIAICGNIDIDTKWSAETTKNYEIYQVDYNPKNNETIVSLKEVRNE